MQLTAARLRELVHYDPDTGVFTSRADSRGQRYPAGRVVGGNAHGGYFKTQIDGTRYYLHRLAWLYMTGEWPRGTIDHRDCNPSNNRWTNLRDVTQAVNTQNLRGPRRSNHSTGVLGVSFDPQRGKFAAGVKKGFVRLRGRFDSLEAAQEFYINAKRQLHEGCTL